MQNKNVYFSEVLDYTKLADEELVKLASENDDKQAINQILDRYKDAVSIKASNYFINGAEKEDIIQEGLIGLFKSIKSFNKSKATSFKSFANLCIERQIITAIKSSNRQKHIPLNSYVSLNNTSYENEDGEPESQLIDVLNTHTIEDPLDTITKNEYYQDVEVAIDKSLSPFEKQVLNKYVQGESYVQIAESLNSPVKSIDNAIQRIRKKTAKNIENLT